MSYLAQNVATAAPDLFHMAFAAPHPAAAQAMMKRQRQLQIAEQLSQQDAEEYGEDILHVMHEQELQRMPCVASIDIQTEIEWFMRPYLLDFLIEAHAAFALQEETLFLAVNILDRYCSKRVVYRKHYQLVGCTALLIAAKYDECSKKVPHIKELASMCCSLYEEDMFIQMERHIMMTLDWAIGAPTVGGFIAAAQIESPHDPATEAMALYIAEIALFHRDFVAQRPSAIAKASLALARIVLNRPPVVAGWVAEVHPDTLVALSQHLHHPSQILVQKYSTPALCKVSVQLDDFLERHAAIARAPPSEPLTPPADAVSVPLGLDGCAETPKPRAAMPAVQHGCLTPPITPETDSFGNVDRMCPATPTVQHGYGHGYPNGAQAPYGGAAPIPSIYVQPAI